MIYEQYARGLVEEVAVTKPTCDESSACGQVRIWLCQSERVSSQRATRSGVKQI